MGDDGVVSFPDIELDEIAPANMRQLAQEYFEQCWGKSVRDYMQAEMLTLDQ